MFERAVDKHDGSA